MRRWQLQVHCWPWVCSRRSLRWPRCPLRTSRGFSSPCRHRQSTWWVWVTCAGGIILSGRVTTYRHWQCIKEYFLRVLWANSHWWSWPSRRVLCTYYHPYRYNYLSHAYRIFKYVLQFLLLWLVDVLAHTLHSRRFILTRTWLLPESSWLVWI